MRSKLIAAFFAVSLLLIQASCKTQPKSQVEEEYNFCLDENMKSKIEFIHPQFNTIVEGIELNGSVESDPNKVIHIAAMFSGIISKTFVTLGDYVKKGQILAEVNSNELSSFQSDLNSLNTQLKSAQVNFSSVEALFKDGLASKKELQEAESAVEVLKSEKNKIQKNLKLFSAQPEKGVFQIIAPIDGIITTKTINAGMTISNDGQSLFTISDLAEVWIMMNIYANQIENIRPEMEVNISSFAYPGQVFHGKINSISQVFDADEKVLKARIVMDNKSKKFIPGMLVNINVMNQHDKKAISIPVNCLVFDDNQNFIVQFNDDCNIKVKKVEVISRNNDIVYLANNLDTNMQIISKHHLLIYEQIKHD